MGDRRPGGGAGRRRRERGGFCRLGPFLGFVVCGSRVSDFVVCLAPARGVFGSLLRLLLTGKGYLILVRPVSAVWKGITSRSGVDLPVWL